MKKSLSVLAIVFSPFILAAQEVQNNHIDREVFRTCSIILVIALFMLFFLAIIRKFIDFRIKSKIVDKGIPESMASSLLQTNPNEDRNSYVKWGTVIAGLGVGLTIVNYTLPLGFHSLAIMAFCVSISLIAYYLLIRYLDEKSR
jgi:hypothetical protein